MGVGASATTNIRPRSALTANSLTAAARQRSNLADAPSKIGPVTRYSNGLVTSTDQRELGNNGQVITTVLASTMVRRTKVTFTWSAPTEGSAIVNLGNANASTDTLVWAAAACHAQKVAPATELVRLSTSCANKTLHGNSFLLRPTRTLPNFMLKSVPTLTTEPTLSC